MFAAKPREVILYLIILPLLPVRLLLVHVDVSLVDTVLGYHISWTPGTSK